jgi:undecaprenyl-diphosphatase
MTVTAASMLNYITTRDHRMMQRVNNWRAPQWVRVWMLTATRGGDGWLWYAMCLAVLVWGGEDRFRALLAVLQSFITSTTSFIVLKRLIGRKRPCDIAPHCWATLLPPDRFSFPSGHAMTACSMAVSFGMFYPSWLVGLLFCAASIALSRIILGLHFLSDVLVGASMGLLLGYLAYVVHQ